MLWARRKSKSCPSLMAGGPRTVTSCSHGEWCFNLGCEFLCLRNLLASRREVISCMYSSELMLDLIVSPFVFPLKSLALLLYFLSWKCCHLPTPSLVWGWFPCILCRKLHHWSCKLMSLTSPLRNVLFVFSSSPSSREIIFQTWQHASFCQEWYLSRWLWILLASSVLSQRVTFLWSSMAIVNTKPVLLNYKS